MSPINMAAIISRRCGFFLDGEITVVEKNLYQDEDGNMIETVRNYYEILRSQEKIQN